MKGKKPSTTRSKPTTTKPPACAKPAPKHKQAPRHDNSSGKESEPEEEEWPKKKSRSKQSKAVLKLSDSDEEDLGKDNENEEQSSEDEGELHEQHIQAIPTVHPVKKDSTKDLLTIFSDHVTVKFVSRVKTEEGKGRWCKVCKADTRFIKQHGKQHAFHMGGNSSLQSHIHRHYNLYKTWCREHNLMENHWAIPRDIWNEMEATKSGKKSTAQQNIEFEKLEGPKEFT
ncbi:hypothetical protein DXG01_002279 [Tephrocybe rancida]|nr:hypothetical protein DXG01_002279 [Tephrocybe rancida]